MTAHKRFTAGGFSMTSEVTVQLPHHEIYEALVNCTNHLGNSNRLQELGECVDLKLRRTEWAWGSPIASEYGTLWLPLVHWACLLGKFVALHWFKSNEVDLSVKCGRGDESTNLTALHSAIWFVHHEELPKFKNTGVKRAEHFGKVMDVIVEANPAILLETEEPSGDTILHVCSRKVGHDEKTIPEYLKIIFQKLQSYKVYDLDIDSFLCQKNRDGETFLHLLVKIGSRGTIFAIKETQSQCGEQWHRLCATKDLSGKTPRDIAAENKALAFLDVFKGPTSDILEGEKNPHTPIKNGRAVSTGNAEASKKDNAGNKSDSSNECSSANEDKGDEVMLQHSRRESQGYDHTPFCERKCKAKHHRVLLSLNRCTNKLTNDQFIQEIEKYLGTYRARVRTTMANADLKDPSYSFPIIHWACALGKHEALKRLAEWKEFNMDAKAGTGETGLHRAVRCLYRGMGEPTKVAETRKVSQVFSRILDVLTDYSCDVFLESDDSGDTVLHVTAKEMHHCRKDYTSKFRFLQDCMGDMVKKLVSWQKSEEHAELAVSVLTATNDREQNFVHILARVADFRSDSVRKLLKDLDVSTLRKLLSVQDCIDETPRETAERKGSRSVAKFFTDLISSTEPTASPVPKGQQSALEGRDTESTVSPVPKGEQSALEGRDTEPTVSTIPKSQQSALEDEDTEPTVTRITTIPKGQQSALEDEITEPTVTTIPKSQQSALEDEDTEPTVTTITTIPKGQQSALEDEITEPTVTTIPKSQLSVLEDKDTKQQNTLKVGDSEPTISPIPRSKESALEDIYDISLQSPKMTVVDFVAQLSSSPNSNDIANPHFEEESTNQHVKEDVFDTSDSHADCSEEIRHSQQAEAIEEDHSNESPRKTVTAEKQQLQHNFGKLHHVSANSDPCITQSYTNLISKQSNGEVRAKQSNGLVDEESRDKLQPATSSDHALRNPAASPDRFDTERTPGGSLKRKMEFLMKKAVEKEETLVNLKTEKLHLSEKLQKEKDILQERQAKRRKLQKQLEEVDVEIERSSESVLSLEEDTRACVEQCRTLEIQCKDLDEWVDTVSQKVCSVSDLSHRA